MFIYLKISEFGSSIVKIGCTARHPRHRLDEYRTCDAGAKYYAIAEFNHIDRPTLVNIEKECLKITKKYGKNLELYPNNECRYADPDVIWDKCKSTFKLYYIEHKDLDDIKDTGETAEIETTNLFKDYSELSLEDEFPYELKGYQIEAYQTINKIMTQSIKNNMVNLNVLCRCGKTVLFMKYMFDNFEFYDMFVYAAPRLNLIRNMIPTFQKVFKDKVSYIEVSSNISSDIQVLKNEKLKAATLKRKVLMFVCNNSFKNIEHVITSKKKALRILFIFDEAHYLCGSKKNNPIVLLDDIQQNYTNLDYSKFVVTATPKYGNFITDKNMLFMNDPIYFGPLSNRVRFNNIHEAMQQKFICPVKLVIGYYETTTETLVETKVASNISKSIQLIVDCIKDPNLTIKPKKILMYANKVQSVNDCYSTLISNPEFKDYEIYKMVSGMHPSQQRDALVNFDKATKNSILVNCRMITEGINITTLDTVVFIDPKYEKADIVQILMRPRTYEPDKQSYIMIPQDINTTSGFETIKTVIQELILNNDPNVNDIIIKKCRNHSSNTPSEAPAILHEVDSKFKKVIMDITKAELDKIGTSPKERILLCLQNNVMLTLEDISVTASISNPAECNTLLENLVIEHKIKYEVYNNIKYYALLSSIKTQVKLTKAEFIDQLKELGVTNEFDYRLRFLGMYSLNFPLDPRKTYPGFKWGVLSKDEIATYSFKDCKNAIVKLMSTETISAEISNIYLMSDKVKKLREYDSNIPENLNDYENEAGYQFLYDLIENSD